MLFCPSSLVQPQHMMLTWPTGLGDQLAYKRVSQIYLYSFIPASHLISTQPIGLCGQQDNLLWPQTELSIVTNSIAWVVCCL